MTRNFLVRHCSWEDSADYLSIAWQDAIVTHVAEQFKQFVGVIEPRR
jgi:hypothetical protein